MKRTTGIAANRERDRVFTQESDNREIELLSNEERKKENNREDGEEDEEEWLLQCIKFAARLLRMK